MIKITTPSDGGSIQLVNAESASDIQLRLTCDNQANEMQWFYFKCETSLPQQLKIRIVNAADSSFSNAWIGYQAVASYDQENWFRVPTEFINGELVISSDLQQRTIYFAYFTPYSLARHRSLIDKVTNNNQVNLVVLGKTHDDHPIELLQIGEDSEVKPKVWLIARQHPGETMAQWFIEQTIEALLEQTVIANSLLQNCTFYIVPNMNPDGSYHGNHRTNRNGINLNRVWDNPSPILAPEVFLVKRAMKEIGVDLFLDVHGDEAIPLSFIMSETNSVQMKTSAEQFKQSLLEENSYFQTKVDYNTAYPKLKSCCGSGCGKSTRNKATDFVSDEFGCLSMILELPFIDLSRRMESPEKLAQSLGRSILRPIFDQLEARV